MSKVSSLRCIAVLLATPVLLPAQLVTRPTAKDIQKAIAYGKTSDESFSLLFANPESALTDPGSVIAVTTPMCRIAQAAADATRKYKAFSAAEVTLSMLRPQIEVVVEPVLYGGEFTAPVLSVEHVVLIRRTNARIRAIQPQSTAVFTKAFENRIGMKKIGRGLTAVFAIADLDEQSELRAIYDQGAERIFLSDGLTDCDPDMRARERERRRRQRDAESERKRRVQEEAWSHQISGLVQQLNGPSAVDRAFAASALGEFGIKAKSAIPDLVHALKDESVAVKTAAAQALGQIGPAAAEAEAALEDAANDSAIRYTAIEALKKIRQTP